MTWTVVPQTAAQAQALVSPPGPNAGGAAVVADDWVQIRDGAGQAVAVGAFLRGRFLMNEELFPAAALKLSAPATTAGPLALPAAALAELVRLAGEAGLLFVSGARLDHQTMTAGGFARWFTHAGQAFLRRDQLAPALAAHLAAAAPLAHLTAAPPTAETLDSLYNNYCTLTGQWPRYRRPLTWWRALLARTDVVVRGIELPTYDEEDPESLTGPRDVSGYVVYRDAEGRREFLETVISVIDGDEDENIDLLLNDTLHTLVRGGFGLGSAGGAPAAGPIHELLWHGSPGDLLWSRCSMYGCEMREQTSTHYLQVLKPDLVAAQLIRPAIEQDAEGDFEGEITVDLTDLEKIAFRRKGNRKAGRLTVRMNTAEFVSCMLHPYRLTGLVQEGGVEFDCDDPEVDPMWVVFSSLFDVLHPFWPVLE